jgi:hypothetical protein
MFDINFLPLTVLSKRSVLFFSLLSLKIATFLTVSASPFKKECLTNRTNDDLAAEKERESIELSLNALKKLYLFIIDNLSIAFVAFSYILS